MVAEPNLRALPNLKLNPLESSRLNRRSRFRWIPRTWLQPGHRKKRLSPKSTHSSEKSFKLSTTARFPTRSGHVRNIGPRPQPALPRSVRYRDGPEVSFLWVSEMARTHTPKRSQQVLPQRTGSHRSSRAARSAEPCRQQPGRTEHTRRPRAVHCSLGPPSDQRVSLARDDVRS